MQLVLADTTNANCEVWGEGIYMDITVGKAILLSSRALNWSVDSNEESEWMKKLIPQILTDDIRPLSVQLSLLKGESHKCFLSVCSPVLLAMFQSWTAESQSGQVDMTDVSDSGVRAFLHFVYNENLTLAKEDVEVAFEAFYIAHKYNVRRLEAEMIACLVDWKNDDFKVELAFRIYIFSRNISTAEGLKAKIVRILKIKFDEMENLKEYKDLFQKDPNTAMELFRDLIKSS